MYVYVCIYKAHVYSMNHPPPQPKKTTGKTPKAPPMPKACPTSEPATTMSSAAPTNNVLSLTGLTFGEFAPLAKALEAAAKRRTRVRRRVGGCGVDLVYLKPLANCLLQKCGRWTDQPSSWYWY